MESIKEIAEWSKLYMISFQFWPTQYNVWVYRDDVEIMSLGGRSSVDEIMGDCLQWLRKANPSHYRNNILNQATEVAQ